MTGMTLGPVEALKNGDVLELGLQADAACRVRFGRQVGYRRVTHLVATVDGWRLLDRRRPVPEGPLGDVRILRVEVSEQRLMEMLGTLRADSIEVRSPQGGNLKVVRLVVGPVELFEDGRRTVIDDQPWEAALAQARESGCRLSIGFAYGNDEPAELLVNRLQELRALQDRIDVFAPVPINAQREREQPGEISYGYDDVRLFAVARLMLDAVPHIQVPWLAFGMKAGQMALLFGADDLGPWALDPAVTGFADLGTYLAVREEEILAAVRALKLDPVVCR
ncbi:MAG: hypothetical protein ACYCW6_01115 [Candidatus Xenobia bacterium]